MICFVSIVSLSVIVLIPNANATPPLPVTSPTATQINTTTIKLGWANPADTSFQGTTILRNGTWIINATGQKDYFQFNTTLANIQNSTHTLTTHGTPAYDTGIRDRSLKFDGTQYYTMPLLSNINWNKTHSWSINVWVNASASSTGRDIILTDESGGGQNGWRLEKEALSLSPNQVMRFTYGTSETSIDGCAIHPNVWYDLAVVSDGTNIKLYCNGVQNGTGTITSEVLSTNSEPLSIGDFSGGAGNRWVGVMDEMRLFSGYETQKAINNVYTDTVGKGTSLYDLYLGSSKLYNYQICSVGYGGQSTTCPQVSLFLNGIPAPTISKVNTINSTAINATWTKPSETNWFWANFTLLGGATTHINTTQTTLTLNNFTAGSKYTLSIVAVNSTAKSTSSITKYNYTFNVAPTVPTLSSITSSQMRLGWTNPGGGANLTGGFNIYKVTALGINYTLLVQTSNNTNHYDPTSLLGNREYSFKLATRYAVGTNYTGVSTNSTIVTAYTLPGTPTGLTITQRQVLVAHLSWTPITDNGTILGTKIERSNNGGTSWTIVNSNTGNTTSAYNDTVPNAGTFTYRVSTIKYGGTSLPSSTASRSIWNFFTVNAYEADGATSVYGQAIQSNSTSNNNRFALVSGHATIPGISQLNNFTIFNLLINFIVGKSYNYNATTNHNINMSTNDYTVDCPLTGTGPDVEVWTNGTNGHRITTFTTPVCSSNSTIKWTTKFTANGNDLNSYNTTVYVKVLNQTYATVAPLKYNQTKVTTVFTTPYIISNNVLVGTGLQTQVFNWSMNLTVSPAFTPVNFTVGHISVSGVNPVTMPIKFTTTPVNSTATSVAVTFPSTYKMAYLLTYGNEGTVQTLTGLPVTSPSLGLGQSVITFKNPGNDFVTIKAYDTLTNTTASTVLSQPNTNIPFVTQFKNFKNGLFGTSAMIGGINIIDLIVLIVAMIGLNRANEIVGAFMMVIIVGVAAFFQIITWPTALVSGIALAVLVTVVTMKKYQNS